LQVKPATAGSQVSGSSAKPAARRRAERAIWLKGIAAAQGLPGNST